MAKRSEFSSDFVWGTASSAHQYEGAAKEDGKGPNICDTFSERYPERIKDRSTGFNAIDSYHRYKEDVQIMKKMGLNAYRFSIAWSRILPGIEPFVTIFHWDVPQALEDEYGGFLSTNIM
ncbi:hypothetical protein LguiB_012982 [Lonicera macranthoides]